jgi:hypothetical protein
MAREAGIVPDLTRGNMLGASNVDALALALDHHTDHVPHAEGHLCMFDAYDLGDYVQDVLVALQEFCPPYCSVATAEGDGACLGVFPNMERVQVVIDSAVDCGEFKINIEEGVIIDVNDHGNVSIYAIARGEALLEVV